MNKTALITGATSGIGASFAGKLAAQGYNLIVTGRRREIIQKLADEIIKKNNVQVKVVLAELSDRKDIDKLLEIVKSHNDIEMLVNNAGYGLQTDYLETGAEELEAMITVHDTVTVQLTHAVLPQMLKAGRGFIINVSSFAGVCITKSLMYGATKAFLNYFSESLHLNFHKKGIKVQALCPGFTRTDFHMKLDMKLEEKNK